MEDALRRGEPSPCDADVDAQSAGSCRRWTMLPTNGPKDRGRPAGRRRAAVLPRARPAGPGDLTGHDGELCATGRQPERARPGARRDRAPRRPDRPPRSSGVVERFDRTVFAALFRPNLHETPAQSGAPRRPLSRGSATTHRGRCRPGYRNQGRGRERVVSRETRRAVDPTRRLGRAQPHWRVHPQDRPGAAARTI